MPTSWEDFEVVDPSTIKSIAEREPDEEEDKPKTPTVELSPYEKAQLESSRAGRGMPETGQEPGTGLLTSITEDVKGVYEMMAPKIRESARAFAEGSLINPEAVTLPARLPEMAVRQLPQKILAPIERGLEYAGNVTRGVVTDAFEELSGIGKDYETLTGLPYTRFHNLAAAALGERDLPFDRVLARVAEDSVATATAGQLAEGLLGTAPMIVAFKGVPAAAHPYLLAGFAAQMLTDIPEVSKELIDEFNLPKEEQNKDKIAKLISRGIQDVGFGFGAAFGFRKAAKEGVKTAEELRAEGLTPSFKPEPTEAVVPGTGAETFVRTPQGKLRPIQGPAPAAPMVLPQQVSRIAPIEPAPLPTIEPDQRRFMATGAELVRTPTGARPGMIRPEIPPIQDVRVPEIPPGVLEPTKLAQQAVAQQLEIQRAKAGLPATEPAAPVIPAEPTIPAGRPIPEAAQIPGAAEVEPARVPDPIETRIPAAREVPSGPKLPRPLEVTPEAPRRVGYDETIGLPLPERTKTLSIPQEMQHLKPLFEVVKDGWDMPADVVRDAIQRRGTPELVDAVWHRGKLYLNASRLQDPRVLSQKLVHEVAIHYGLEKAVGPERMRGLATSIWDTLDVNDKRDIIQRNGLEDYDRAAIGEEWLAYEAERVSQLGRTDTLWNRIATRIAQFMRNVLRLPFKYTDLEIARMIAKGKEAAEEGVNIPVDTGAGEAMVGQAPSTVEVREARAKHLSRTDGAYLVSTPKEGQVASITSPESGGQVVLPNKFSMVDYEKIWRPTALGELLKNGVPRAKAERWLADMDQLTSMAVTEADKAGLLDRIPREKRKATGLAPNEGVVRNNADYIISWDASGICTLRVPATDYLNALVGELTARGKNAGMNEVEREMVLTMLARKGMPRPCVICYVETRRALRQKLADEYARWLTDEPLREEQKEGMQDPNEDMVAAKTYATENKLKYKDINQSVFLDDREFQKAKKDPNSHVSQHRDFYRRLNKQITANASKVFGMASYKGQYRFIPKNVLDWAQMSGGLRFYSISDFMFEHAVDLMQTISDIAGKSRGHIYTKQPGTVDMLKNTGMKINLSLVPMIDSSGNIVEWSGQSFPWELAKELSSKNPDIGITMLATNDRTLAWALEQPWVHYVLPFHRSGMYEPMFRELQAQQGWHDYEKSNGRNKGKEQRLYKEDEAKWAKFEEEYKKRFPGVDHEPTWKIGWFLNGKAMSDADIVKRALADSEKYGFALPFDRWMRNPDGTPNPNAAKLLKDYGRTDTPQRTVEPNFDHGAFSNLMNEWIKNKGSATKISDGLVKDMADELERYRQWTENWKLPSSTWASMSPSTEQRTWAQLIRTGLDVVQRPTEALVEAAGKVEALPETAPRKFSFGEIDREAEIRAAGRTAIGRPEASEPTQWLMNAAQNTERRGWDSGFGKGKSVLHFGSGKDKASTELLGSAGATVKEYDPTYAPDRSVITEPHDRVVSNFVLNVLPPELRDQALQDLQTAVGRDGIAYISVRAKGDTSIKGTPEFDGVRTSKGTFQKGYTVQELRSELGKHFHHVEILRGTDKTKSIIAEVQRPVTHWEGPYAPRPQPLTRPEENKYAMGRGPIPPYSSIQQLTDQLNARKAFGTRESLSMKQRLVDAWAKGQSVMTASIGRMQAVGQTIKETARGVRRPEDIDRELGRLDWLLQQSAAMSKNNRTAMERTIKNKTMRNAMALWIDAGGDDVALRNAAGNLPASTPGHIRRAVEMASNLPPDAIQEAQGIMQYYALKAQDAINNDVFGQAIEDYYTHVWKKPENMPDSIRAAIGNGKVNTYFQFARHRSIHSFIEGIMGRTVYDVVNARGRVTGTFSTRPAADIAAAADPGATVRVANIKPKEPVLDPADILPFYNYIMDRAIASRRFIRAVSDLDASDGRPALAPTGTAVRVDRGTTMSDMLILPKAKGENLEGYRPIEHPALRGWKWATKDERGNDIFYQVDLQVHPEFYERIARIMDRKRLTPSKWASRALRVSAEFKAAKLSAVPSAFHQVHVGTHALWHWTNPLPALFERGGIEWDSPATQFAIEKGHLKIAPNPAELADFSEVLGGQGLVNKIPILGPASKAYSEWLFGQYIPRLKLRTFENAYQRNLKWYDRDIRAGRITEEEIASRVGDSVNNAYGELNHMFLQKFGRDPQTQRLLRGMFLAPDFGEARMRFVGKTLTRYGMEERLAMATMFTTLYTTARLANWATHGDPEWDKKNAFAVKVGEEWFSMRSVIGDLLHLFTEPGQFMYVRLNPIYSRTLGDIIFGRDVSGRKLSGFEKFIKRPLQQLIPIQFSNLTREDQHLWESFVSAAGLQSRHETAAWDVRKLVNEWLKKNPDPRLRDQWEVQEQEVFAKSRYGALRRALEHGDMPKAKKEYDRIREVRTDKDISEALRPMTKDKMGIWHEKPMFLSRENEKLFVSSLTEPQRRSYEKALQDRRDIWTKYLEMKSTQF